MWGGGILSAKVATLLLLLSFLFFLPFRIRQLQLMTELSKVTKELPASDLQSVRLKLIWEDSHQHCLGFERIQKQSRPDALWLWHVNVCRTHRMAPVYYATLWHRSDPDRKTISRSLDFKGFLLIWVSSVYCFSSIMYGTRGSNDQL